MSNHPPTQHYTLLVLMIIFGCISGCRQMSEPEEDMDYYTETHRPQFHFSPESKWMNDPNGMVYYEGEYHLFYQYYPDSTVWGPMHWGHAVSKDLMHWEHLPIALFPDEHGYIFSGSAVVDWNNTSELGKNGQPPLIAIFTYHDPEGEKAGKIDFQTQGIAYSNDKGRTWTKYEGNPVIPNPGIRDFRDPKVFWHQETEQWVMIFAAADRVKIYTSSNLKNWTHQSDFGEKIGAHGGVWECPDLFPMTVEGTTKKRWIMLVSINPGGPNGGSGTQYFVGDFDGKTFTLDENFAEKNLGREEAYIPEGVVFEDFERNNYDGWQVEGDAFGNQPVRGTFEGQNPVSGYTGNQLVNSFLNGDATTGKLTSADFTIEKDFINFQIGGGNSANITCMNLLIGGEVLRTAVGGNSGTLHWDSWNVSDLKGQTAKIEIVDEHTGGWGHINVDQIVFSDEAARGAFDKSIWLDYGKDNYAGVTWADVPEKDGRKLFLGWMSNWQYAQQVPTSPWRSAMTLPRQLSLIESAGEAYQVISKPVEETKNLRTKASEMGKKAIAQKLDLSREMSLAPGALELKISFDISEKSELSIELSNNQGENVKIGYSANENEYFVDRSEAGDHSFSTQFGGRHSAPRFASEKNIQMHLFIDLASVELFADQGRTVITENFFPTTPFNQINVVVKGGTANMLSAKAWSLERVW